MESAKVTAKYNHCLNSKTIKLVGQDNVPLVGKEVTVRQTRHEFLFGCSEFSCVPLANGELHGQEKEMAEEKFEKFSSLFKDSFCSKILIKDSLLIDSH
jgi:hypothetical protein